MAGIKVAILEDMFRRAATVAIGLATLGACSSSPSTGSGAPTTGDPGTTGGAVTFHKDVEPILQRSCQGCDVPGGIAPFGLVTYAEAHVVAAAMVDRPALGDAAVARAKHSGVHAPLWLEE